MRAGRLTLIAVTRHERIEARAAGLTEPSRERVRAIMKARRTHGMLFRDHVGELRRMGKIGPDLALLLAYDAIEWVSGGAIRVGEDEAKPASFWFDVFPSEHNVGCAVALAVDASGGSAHLHVAISEPAARKSEEVDRAIGLVCRELAQHLQLSVRRMDVKDK